MSTKRLAFRKRPKVIQKWPIPHKQLNLITWVWCLFSDIPPGLPWMVGSVWRLGPSAVCPRRCVQWQECSETCKKREFFRDDSDYQKCQNLWVYLKSIDKFSFEFNALQVVATALGASTVRKSSPTWEQPKLSQVTGKISFTSTTPFPQSHRMLSFRRKKVPVLISEVSGGE